MTCDILLQRMVVTLIMAVIFILNVYQHSLRNSLQNYCSPGIPKSKVKKLFDVKGSVREESSHIEPRKTRAVALRCSVKKLFLKYTNAQENTCARVSFLGKLQVSFCNFVKKETLAQVLLCEFCEIS